MKPTPKPPRKPSRPGISVPSRSTYSPAPALEGDPLAKLLPKLTPKQREIAGQLMARGGDIQQWFAEDPSRVEALQANPYETINSLARALDLTLPVAQASELPKINIVFNPLDCVCPPPPNSLFTAVWQYIGQSEMSLSAWNADPFAVINQVAASTGASQQEVDALTAAFERVFGLIQTPVNPLTAIALIQGIRPSQLIVR